MILDLSNHIDKNKALTRLGSLIDKECFVELTEIKPKRTLNQNAYLHACFGYIAKETGYLREEAKIMMKRTFGSFMIYENNGHKFCRSTADLDTNEMTQFIDWLRLYASEEIGLYLMTPEEYMDKHREIRKELEYVK